MSANGMSKALLLYLQIDIKLLYRKVELMGKYSHKLVGCYTNESVSVACEQLVLSYNIIADTPHCMCTFLHPGLLHVMGVGA